ncbi:mRNA decay activator protein ZFP36L1-like [Protopterus annectens]|uniref:mRNA decay activator protein ZFP36L1-like n=1 Tax=Protopterus annectens TaxID=7888 RepID=UPI001CF938DC|nr:mRNA decay activator protein ZFP36L1-like [Protopterus annectens]
MPSDFITPFQELEDAFCKSFLCLKLTEPSGAPEKKTVGFHRRLSSRPDTVPRFNGSSTDSLDNSCWSLNCSWNRDTELPRSNLNHIPFLLDRSISMIDNKTNGFSVAPSASETGVSTAKTSPAVITSRYKTELCRTFEENGTCKYGEKCQFAHGQEELRGLSRHPKYKTELCRTYHTVGYCPYGTRCHFIHNAEEQRLVQTSNVKLRQERPQLRQSVSFGGFPSNLHFQNLQEPPAFSRTLSASTPPSGGSPDLHSSILPEPGPLNRTFFCSDHLNMKPASCIFPAAKLGCAYCGYCESKLQSSIVKEKYSQCKTAFILPGISARRRTSSTDSLSDQEGSSSSSSLAGSESPDFDSCGRRLPIFSSLSLTED